MNQIEQNEKISKSFSKSKYSGDNHNYQTRSVTKKLLDILSFGTKFYGTHSQPNITVSLAGTILKYNFPR